MTCEEKYQQIMEQIRSNTDVCPIMYVMTVIGQKWKIPVLWQLAQHEVPMRFSEIRRSLNGPTDAVLSKTLDDLEHHQLIDRVQYDCIPPRVEYTLSCRGTTLLPALLALRDWGAEQMKEIGEDCSPEK